MVEYHNNQASPNPDSSSMATMLFVLLAIAIIVIGAIYLFPRLGQNTDTDGSNTRIQIDTPLGDGDADTGGTGSGDTGGSGDTTQ